MADPAKILERIRAAGANIEIDAGKMRIINRAKLPAEAGDFIRKNAKAIAAYLEQEHAVEERAAIIEFDGRSPRQWAEDFAKVLISEKPVGVDEMDWSWFITRCGQMIDEGPDRRAA